MTSKTFWVGTLIAGGLGVAQVLAELDPMAVTDWKTWFIALSGAFIRPAAAWIVTRLAVGDNAE